MGKLDLKFSQRLHSLVSEKGLNNKEFAKLIGISENAATNYQKKGRVPEADILLKISDSLNVSTDWLLKNNDDLGNLNKIHPIEKKHIEVIRNFKNKQLALEINQNLVELEKIDPAELHFFQRELDRSLEKLRFKEEKNRLLAEGTHRAPIKPK